MTDKFLHKKAVFDLITAVPEREACVDFRLLVHAEGHPARGRGCGKGGGAGLSRVGRCY
ncbi:MAG TPA: hypothetical protein VNU72_10235 [Puia sp.]|nr:hypothetical protein [Puia sp.]